MKRLQIVTILLMSALSFCGCKSWQKVVEVPVYIHDTTYTAKEIHDSTYIDKWHTIYVKGDTVYKFDSVSVIKYRLITDTAYKYIEVPVTVTQTEIKEVKKPLSWWQKTFIGVGVLSFLLIIGAIAFKFIKLYGKR